MHLAPQEARYSLQFLLLHCCYLMLSQTEGHHPCPSVFWQEISRQLFSLEQIFEVTDQNAFKQLVESFFKVASRIEEQQDSASTNLSIHSFCADDDVSLGPQNNSFDISSPAARDDIITQAEGNSSSTLVNNYGHMSAMVPGLNFIRNQVIKPLLFATEKVVEQYI